MSSFEYDVLGMDEETSYRLQVSTTHQLAAENAPGNILIDVLIPAMAGDNDSPAEKLQLLYTAQNQEYQPAGELGAAAQQLYPSIILALDETHGSLWG